MVEVLRDYQVKPPGLENFELETVDVRYLNEYDAVFVQQTGRNVKDPDG